MSDNDNIGTPEPPFRKWLITGLAGIPFLGLTVYCFLKDYWEFVLASAFLGFFLIYTGIKKTRLLKAGLAAAAAGKKTIAIHYRDGNLKESDIEIIPIHSDSLFLYGFLREQNNCKPLRWKYIRYVTQNGNRLNMQDVLNLINA